MFVVLDLCSLPPLLPHKRVQQSTHFEYMQQLFQIVAMGGTDTTAQRLAQHLI